MWDRENEKAEPAAPAPPFYVNGLEPGTIASNSTAPAPKDDCQICEHFRTHRCDRPQQVTVPREIWEKVERALEFYGQTMREIEWDGNQAQPGMIAREALAAMRNL